MSIIDNIETMTNINEVADLRDQFDPISNEWLSAETKLRQLLLKKYPEEQVLVVETMYIPDGIQSGFTPANQVSGDIIHNIDNFVKFKPRASVEFNPYYKQIIPYVVVVDENKKVFAMTRLAGDSRLIGNISLGVGGHINPVDDTGSGTLITQGLMRELEEEVFIAGAPKQLLLDFKGIIYDNSNKVGQDHLGMVYTYTLLGQSISVRETDVLDGQLVNVSTLGKEYDRLENWSKIVYNNILE